MKKVLLISRVPKNNATTIEDHVNAIVELSVYQVTNIDVNDPNLSLEILTTDCILLHYSIIAYPYRGDHILNSYLRLQISRAGKPVFHMVQDEQRNALERFRYFETLGVVHVFSVAKEEVYNLMYPVEQRNFSVSTILTGYMPINLDGYRAKEWDSRSRDISYRARKLPEWYGQLGFRKSDVSDRLREMKKSYNLAIDASCEEDDRLYGHEWINFLCDSKVAIGTESGSSTIDMDGRFLEEWQNKSSIGSYLKMEPVLANYAAISPRIFEYAAAKCLIALTPGEYSGVLSPGLHYFELQPDFSNFEDLVLLMNDKEERNRLIRRSYEDLILSQNYGYQRMVREVDRWLDIYINPTENLQVSEVSSLDIELEIEWCEQILETEEILTFIELSKKSFNSFKRKALDWGLSRRGITRVLLRSIFRSLRKIWRTKLMDFFKLLLTPNFNVGSEYKEIFKVTRRIFISFRLIPELEFIRSEAKIISNQGVTLKLHETNAGLWISWPESIHQDSKLKASPKLDGIFFPDHQGVWFTRSDFSEVNKPLQLRYFSKYYKRDKIRTLSLIQIYCGPQ